jgi:hypothetical protein
MPDSGGLGFLGALLTERLGRKVLQIGPLVQITGAILLWFELDDTGSFSIWQIAPGVVVAGIGSGLVIAALFSFILNAVDDHETGSASGVLSAVQSIGSSIGVAVFGSVFFSGVKSGDPAKGFHEALLVQGALLLAFLAVSAFLPKQARPDDGATDAASAEHADAPTETYATEDVVGAK